MTGNILKRKNITVPSGSTSMLFDIGEDYVSGSFWVFEISPDGTTVTRSVTAETGTYIKLDPAPAPGQKLNIIYEVEQLSSNGGMTEYDYARLEKIAKILQDQADSLKKLKEAVDQRITKKEMLRWQDQVKELIDQVNTTATLQKL